MSTKGKSIVIRGATVVNPDAMFVADVRIRRCQVSNNGL
jgi:hypothetical protein